jgi:hypothetical protein
MRIALAIVFGVLLAGCHLPPAPPGPPAPPVIGPCLSPDNRIFSGDSTCGTKRTKEGYLCAYCDETVCVQANETDFYYCVGELGCRDPACLDMGKKR